jgi:thiamine-phosphate pyrophosphorylase
MTLPRLFLVVPDALDGALLKSCVEAAVAAGDCASILVPESITAEGVAGLQQLGLAVIMRDSEPRLVHRLKADGMHLSRASAVKSVRETLKTGIVGVFAATSRHIAMEAAEAGADYIAFAQKSQKTGEPLLQWWQDIFEVPSVAFDSVAPEDLATLLPQKPDFIRPGDEMWHSPAESKRMIEALTQQMRQ